MNVNLNFGQLINQIVAIIVQLVGLGLVLMIFSEVAKFFGFNIPYIRIPNGQELAYLCGAWWLARKAG